MGLHNGGPSLEFTGHSLVRAGESLNDAISQCLLDMESAAWNPADDFVGSIIDETASLIHQTFMEHNFAPVGNHLAGRNVETEIQQTIEQLTAILNDDTRDAGLRAAIPSEIVKQQQRLAQRDFMQPLRDPEWGGDILELVTRMAPHTIYHQEAGLWVATTVSIKIEAVTFNYDDFGEITTWMYEESARPVWVAPVWPPVES
jgi:hypothetical protein